MRCVLREPPGVSARHIRAFTRTRTRARPREIAHCFRAASPLVRERRFTLSLRLVASVSGPCGPLDRAGLSARYRFCGFTQGTTHPLRPRGFASNPSRSLGTRATRVCISPNNTSLVALCRGRSLPPGHSTRAPTVLRDQHHHHRYHHHRRHQTRRPVHYYDGRRGEN